MMPTMVGTPGGPRGPLGAAVDELCVGLAAQVSPATRTGLDGVRRRLRDPLQLAVAGRIKSGKSTLVNALVGRRIAATDVGECTRVVTRFSYGTVDRLEVVFRDGRRSTRPLGPDGGIPADLGIDPAEIDHLGAYLTSELLRDVTVIDTPGLGSLDAAAAGRTHEVLGGRGGGEGGGGGCGWALARAEAMLYVFTQSVRADDNATLAAFNAATASRAVGPANALAVLNKVDILLHSGLPGDDTGGWAAVDRLAVAQAGLLRPRVADVVPVIGLLAETAEAGVFTAADADALRGLAGVDADLFAAMVLSADLFLTMDVPVSTPARTRLLNLLDLHGIDLAVRVIRSRPDISAGAVRRILLGESGLQGLHHRLGEVFRSRSDGIKASAAISAIADLARTCGDWAERSRIRDGIEVLLAQPGAHQLRLLEAVTAVSNGTVVLPADLTAEVLRLGGSVGAMDRLGLPGATVADLASRALDRAGWWRAFSSFGSTPAQARVAEVVHRAYFLLWRDLTGGERRG